MATGVTHNQPALVALGEVLHLLPHHTRPYRRRHILILLVALAFMGTMFLELAAVVTRQSLDPRNLISNAATPVQRQTLTTVRSANGFAFSFDNEQFAPTALGDGYQGQISDAELRAGKPLSSVTLSPLPSRVPPPEAAAELEVRVETDAAAFATFKSVAAPRQDITAILADYFAPKSTDSVDVSSPVRTTESVSGTLMTKSSYVVTPKFAGNPTRTVVWTSEVQSRPFAITIRGIVTDEGIPTSMAPILHAMQLETATKVQGISTIFDQKPQPVMDQQYIADLVSPAVVKIYHMVCGTLVFEDQALSEDTCSGSMGSGFLVTGDGYIATNGHVVVYGAKDMLVNALLRDSTLLERFLSGSQLSSSQIQEVLQRPELTASIISKIYDLPDSQLRLVNERKLTVVALGETPVEAVDEEQLKQTVRSFAETDSLKQARVIDYDYSPKDQLTVVADPKQGFSSSDVALLKVHVTDAPFIALADSPATLNQKISLFGFPTDAENKLTDNTALDVTVTNGAVSAVREAAGGTSKLYQSDADASRGNSGGPAVNEDGEVIGLLTYRYTSGEVADAAKSYIRDIADFKSLATTHSVNLRASGTVQATWQKGLDLYGRQHYSAAQREFESVQRAYPPHRLAGGYIDLSKQAVAGGKDVREPSVTALTGGAIIGFIGLMGAIILIARQYGRHRVYRTFHSHGLVVRHHAKA